MTRHKKLLVLIPLLIAFGAAAAYAYFTTVGAGSADASTGTLAAPTITTATPSAGSVALAWSAVTAPAGGTVTYYVSRDGGTPAGTCAASSSPTSATSCTDTGLAAGSHGYAVTAVWRSWTATSASTAVTVASGTATHLVLTAATTTPTAGATDNLTITAKDAANNTVTAYTGDKSLTFSGAANAPDGTHPTVSDKTGGAVNFGVATTTTFSSGVASVSGTDNGVMRLYKAETANIAVTDGSIGDTGLSVTVSPASAATLAVSGYQTPTVAGISHSFSVTARDAFGNTASGYTGTVAFSATNDAQAVLPANSSLTAGTGTFNATFKTVAGGTKTLTATDTATSSITGSQTGVVVNPAAAATLQVVGYPSSTVAGDSHPFAVSARDAFGNAATGYAGTVQFSATHDAQAVLPANSILSAGTGSFNATFKTVAGGSKTLTATDTVTSSITGSQTAITVTPAAAASIAVVSGSGQSATVNTAFANPLVALVRDSFANPVAGVSVTFAGPLSGASGTFASTDCTSNSPTSQCVATTGTNGQATSSTFTANATAGAYNVSASAGVGSVAFVLTNVAANTFTVSVPTPLTAGTSFIPTITAKTGAATDTSYTGAKCLTFSGPLSSPSNAAPSYPAQGACPDGQSSVTFSAGVATPSMTLFNALSPTTLTATQGPSSGSSNNFAVNSKGVALSYSQACGTNTFPKNAATTVTINVPNDQYGNPFTNPANMPIGLTLSNPSNFVFPGNSATTTVTIATGPANNTFSVTTSGGNGKTSTITSSGLPTGFALPACSWTTTN